MSPLISKRGASSTKGFGEFVAYGSSEWLWTYRLNPGPSIQWFPDSPAVFYDPVTENTWIAFNTPLSFNTAYFGNWKTAKISGSNVLSYPNANSAYPFTSTSAVYYLRGDGNTVMYAAGYSAASSGKPALFTLDASGNFTNVYSANGFPAGYFPSASSSLSSVSGTYTYFINSQDDTASPTKYPFASINTSSVIGFSKYLTTTAAAAVVVYAIKYNPADGFVYVLASEAAFRTTLLKYTTAGVLQWQRTTTAATTDIAAGLDFLGTNIIVLTVATGAKLITYSTAGTLLSSKSSTALSSDFRNFVKSVSENYYIAYSSTSSSPTYAVFNKSLDLVRTFTVTVTGTGAASISRQIYTDKFDNVYITGYSVQGTAAPRDATQFVIKFPLLSRGAKTYTVGGGTVTVTNGTVNALTTTTTLDAAGTVIENAYANSAVASTWTSSATSVTTTVSIT